jgi:predicted transcriptional regulator
MMQLNDNLRKKDIRFNLSSGPSVNKFEKLESNDQPEFDLNDLYTRWKNFPGQIAQNEPNLRKQVLMLVHLYSTTALRASELFNLSGVGGVTGARYVSTLKKYELIRYTGARKKGKYEITSKGYDFLKDSILQKEKEKGNTAF